MTNEELDKIIAQSEDNYEKLKDKVHDQHEEIERLKKAIENCYDDMEMYRGTIVRQGVKNRRLEEIINNIRSIIASYEYEIPDNDKKDILAIIDELMRSMP